MKNSLIYFSLLMTVLFGTFLSSCKKDAANTKYILMIENGAVTVEPSASVTYTAVLVDKDGNRTTPDNITWTSSATGVATISATGVVSIAGAGVSTIKATVEINGTTLTAEAPLNVRVPGIFVVAPAAILVDTEFPNIQLEPVYLGTGTTTYSYASSNSSIATVSSTGDVDFISAGTCQITVTANGLDGQPQVVVPVVVLGVPEVTFPIVRVEVTPSSHTIFKNETATYSAKAFDSEGNEVTGVSFTWSVSDATVASVNASGQATGLALGSTAVRAMVDGIVGEAELYVTPSKVILLNPYYTSIAAGASRTFAAQLYDVTKDGNGDYVLTAGTTPTLTWEIPTYGLSIFDVATVNSNGTVTVKPDATPGMLTFVVAGVPGNEDIQPSVATISVAMASNCDCGTADPNAASIQISSPSTVTLSMGQTAQIQAQVLDAFGNPISGAAITYCTGDMQVADVSTTGEITALAFTTNSTTITVCHGGLSQTVTVNVP